MTLILRCDIAGTPTQWITPEGAVTLYAQSRVAWDLGEVAIRFRGGRRAVDGAVSVIDVRPIVCATGVVDQRFWNRVPPLCNELLFRRDDHLCLYCGQEFPARQLTRDHVIPRSRGGPDIWENCATACRRCNQSKAARTPEEARMPLLAVPYVPQPAEALILMNRRIIADQMAFLRTRMRKN